MLPTWDPTNLELKTPFVAAAVGGRRQGKSTLVHHLLKRMSKRFDLIVSFMGAAACSPEMKTLLEERFDPRFVFSEWNQPLMDRLLEQQQELKGRGVERQVCILVDDIVLSGRDEESLAHICLRGRHFNVSVMACAVSYTTLPKRSRRSLDVLFLFSCPIARFCAQSTRIRPAWPDTACRSGLAWLWKHCKGGSGYSTTACTYNRTKVKCHLLSK